MKTFLSFFFLTIYFLGWSQGNYTTNFHDTQGKIDVNGGGQLQYTLPIALPPGIKSVAPQLNLVYTSGTGNGIAGYGWNISGITSITRSGRNIEKDGEIQGIKLNPTDYFSFNGQRLILKSGTYGQDGAEYTTEKYSNIKIKSYGIAQSSTQGPMFFHVNFEDGSQAWYGDTQSDDPELNTYKGRTAIEYNIVKWTDNHGNSILYHYEYTTGQMQGGTSRISSVKWGGNETANKPHINEVSFIYIDRDLKEESYVQGVRFFQNKLLKEITVKSAGNQFKKYIVDYFKNGTNYQFVNKITEFSANNEAANPVLFEYPAPVTSSLIFDDNNDNFDGVKFTGDFNGDSYLDFIMSNGSVKLGAFNNDFTTVATNTTFSAQAQIVSTLLDEEGQVHNGNGIVQYENGKIIGYIFRNNNFVKVFEKQVYDNSACNHCSVTTKIQEADIDGDGISNIITKIKVNCPDPIDPNNPCPDPTKPCLDPNPGTLPPGLDREANSAKGNPGELTPLPQCYDMNFSFVVDLKDPALPLASLYDSYDNITNEKFLDVDGDGKVESIAVSNSGYTVYKFVKSGNAYQKLIKFSGSLVENKNSDFPVLFGDFNGDGKLDFTIPITNNQNADHWRFYIGTGSSFTQFLKPNFLKFRTHQNAYENLLYHFYSISDINKDGKSDIIHIYSYNMFGQPNENGDPNGATNYRTYGYKIKILLNDGSSSTGNIDFLTTINNGSGPYHDVWANDYVLFSPLTHSIKANNLYYDIFLYYKHRVHRLKSPSSLSELSQIASIYQAGVTTNIHYKELNPAIHPDFYKKIKKEYYPNFSLLRADQSFAVSQLQQGLRKQDFLYRGMTGHLRGKGMMGFHQTARSSWYSSGYENTKIWNGVEIDPQNDGLPIKEWSIRTTNDQQVFPADISQNNNQLLSFRSTQYKTETLLDGQVVTSYTNAQKPKIVTAILPESSLTKDFLTNTITTGSITYGDYYLPLQSVQNINSGYGIKSTSFQYTHNPSGSGASYFIGRPVSKTDAVQAYGDTQSTKEEYTYDNHLLKTLKTWDKDQGAFLLETYSHDIFGNIIQKTISNSEDTQTQTAHTQYEPTGRFVIKTTDHLGLETTFTHNNKGQVLSQTDPFGNTVTNVYDHWGKLISSNHNLSGTTTYQYQKYNSYNNTGIRVTENFPDGNTVVLFTNTLGQNFKKVTKSFNSSKYIVKETAYDPVGRKIAESEPYETTSITPDISSTNSSTWNRITYNDYVFPPQVTAMAFNYGKTIETTITGNTTVTKEMNGYGRTFTKTTDALGNVLTSTDKGGSVTFSYNASGQNISAQYDGNTVTTEYDNWGRKKQFHDPSNGTYQYYYDGLGKTKRIISPKGEKNYEYTDQGLLSQITEYANDGSTDKNILLEYNVYGQPIKKFGESNGLHFNQNFNYDQYGRLIDNNEIFADKEFYTKERNYDHLGRLVSYSKGIISNGNTTEASIENRYKTWDGSLYQIINKNGVSKPVLWSLNSTNAKGQMLEGSLGKARTNNTYDAYGFLTNTDRWFIPTLVGHPSNSFVQIDYSFNAIKNELNSRTYNAVFNIQETFVYDDNNRLTNWTNPITGQLTYNEYDVRGRIVHNEQVGDIHFNGNSIYQATSMELNSNGTGHYQMNGDSKLLQMISYNENNDPIRIDGTHFDYEFGYGLAHSRQIMHYGEAFEGANDALFSKYYSEAGDFEIIRNNQQDTEKLVIYIGGSPYESDIIYVKDFEGNEGYNFLHKDYLGSILAITDENKNILEQRHYDAWGKLTHLKADGNIFISGSGLEEYLREKTINEGGLIVDRGYTSHEHLHGVELIHMNGRLYDPLLKRFLNADENIQDPYNTQNYNKYGYVMNNPLMYNDPSGEFAFLIPVFAWIAANAVAIGTAALIGAAIGAGMYLVQAVITGNWSWGGFAKSIFMGAITGAVSGALGQVFSASGFWATVGNGALAGAGGGGVTSLINGDAFLEGLLKGAVIGGAVAGISWVVSKTVAYYKSKTPDTITSSELENMGYDMSENSYNDHYTTDQQVQNDFTRTTGDYQASVDNINTEYKLATNQNLPEGYSISDPWKSIITNNPKEGGYVLGLTTGRNKNWWEFLTQGQKSTVLIAPNLGIKSDIIKQAVFGHEYIHAYHRYLGLAAQYGKNFSNYTESSAYHYTINLLKTRGQNFSGFLNQYYNYGASFPGSFNWTYAIKNIVNFKK
ncbi:MAG: hypothetical protein ABS44_05700 [Chryseobacterium sp. SCN 40-13]|nr:MAG: hypothetical protein ABS44_05700 [Chryseobacterium sp. SCN 40-13]